MRCTIILIFLISEQTEAQEPYDWRQRGKSAWAYAKENGLVPQTFVIWTKLENEPSDVFRLKLSRNIKLPNNAGDYLAQMYPSILPLMPGERGRALV